MSIRCRTSLLQALAAAGLLLLPLAGARAQAGNEIANPDFDEGVTSWSAPRGTLTFAPTEDVDDCPGSGAARLSGPELVGGERVLELASSGSCADVEPGEEWAYRVRFFPVVPAAHTDLMYLTYTDDDCTTGELAAPLVGYNVLPSMWIDFQTGGTIQPAVESVRLLLRIRDPASTTIEALIDRVAFGRAASIFLDGFDAESICRWSNATP